MPRRIRSSKLQVSTNTDVDTYFDRLVKYIPSDVVGAWVVANGIVRAAKGTDSQPGTTTLWITFLVGVVFTALWTWIQTSKPDLPKPFLQTALSTGAFVVWAYALGGPFPEWIPGLYKPITASLVLIAFSLVVARVVPK